MRESVIIRAALPLLLGLCSTAQAQISAYHNVTAASHQSRFTSLSQAGYRPISMSIYGTSSSQRYAAVWAKRGGPSWIGFHGKTGSSFQTFYNTYRPQGYVPRILTATGSGSSVRFAGMFEKVGGSSWTRFGLTESQMRDEVKAAHKNGYILQTADVYGSSSSPRYVASFRKNLNNTPWNYAISSGASYPSHFNAFVQGYNRPVQVAINGSSRVLSIWHGTNSGGFYSYNNLSSSSYQSRVTQLGAQGYYPMSVQGTGSGSSIRIAAVFVKRETPLPRVFMTRGAAVASLAGFDAYVKKLMQDNDVHAAGLAVVKDCRLMFARGYTNAESGYPTTQPTSVFRIASISKSITSIAIHQQIERRPSSQINDLSLMVDFFPPITPKDRRTNSIRIRHLLTHMGGWDNKVLGFNPSFADVRIAAAQNVSLPTTRMDTFRYMTTKENLQFTPNNDQKYANYGFRALGMVLENLHPGQTYETIVRRDVFARLGLTRPRIGRSLKSQAAAGEVRYHPKAPGIAQSVVSSNRPWVARQYGGWNQANLAAEGGWIMAAPDMAKVLASFDLNNKNPLMNSQSRDRMWESASSKFPATARGWWRRSVSSKGQKKMMMHHNGGLAGTSTLAVHRSDGVSFVLFLNKDIGLYDSPHGTALSQVADSVTSWPNHDLFPSVGIAPFKSFTKGTAVSYGTGCRGSAGVPQHSLAGTPELGQLIQFKLVGAPRNTTVGLFLGLSKASVDLGFIGAPGCRIYTNTVTTLLMQSNSLGRTTLPGTLPNDTGLIGAAVFTQFGIIDAPANKLGLTMTNGVETTIGGWK
jgi:CubicO group peptidase (beta-lactamase class C family)